MIIDSFLLFSELLLIQCVDLSKRDLKSNTALHYACLNLCEPAALMLLERISEPECIDATNADLRTYLTFTSIALLCVVLDYLTRFECAWRVSFQSSFWLFQIPCFYEFFYGSLLVIVSYVDQSRRNTNRSGLDFCRPLHIAAKNGLVSATQTLLEKGASVMAVDVNGYTPALACAPSAPVADCLSMIVHIMIDSIQNGRRSGSLNLSSFNIGKSLFDSTLTSALGFFSFSKWMNLVSFANLLYSCSFSKRLFQLAIVLGSYDFVFSFIFPKKKGGVLRLFDIVSF